MLIGTPSSPEGDVQIETILTQLRSRQIATEQVETYDDRSRPRSRNVNSGGGVPRPNADQHHRNPS